MRALTTISLLAVLFVPSITAAQVQTYTATHTYILGDQDSKADARERCLLEAKRKILEQAGVYIETQLEMKETESPSGTSVSVARQTNALAAAILQLKDTKEETGFQQGHVTLTLTVTADVDLGEVKKQLDKRHVDTGVRDTVAAQKAQLEEQVQQLRAQKNLVASQQEQLRRFEAQLAALQVDTGVRDDVVSQKERLKRLEAQLEAIQQQRQGGHVPGQTPTPSLSDTAPDTLRTQATQGNASAQIELGLGYALRNDYVQALHWYKKAAAQGDAVAQSILGWLYAEGEGVPQDYAQARHWYKKAAAQGHGWAQSDLGSLYANGYGVPQDFVRAHMWVTLAAAHPRGEWLEKAVRLREALASKMSPAQLAKAQRLAQQCRARQFKGC